MRFGHINAGDSVVIARWDGAWRDSVEVVKRMTATMIIVAWGNGEQRFSRKSGRLIGGPKGMAGMTNPCIDRRVAVGTNTAVSAAEEAPDGWGEKGP